MKNKINTYTAALIITLAGSGAAFFIVRMAQNNHFNESTGYNQASYAELKKSILYPEP